MLYTCTYGAPPSVHPILLQQKAALSEAFKATQNNIHPDEVINKYRTVILPSIVALHALGYPITSFYVDHILFNIILEHKPLSIPDTLNDYINSCRVFVQSCFHNHIGRGYYTHVKPMPCGAAHIHNNYEVGLKALKSLVHTYVPHYFYTKIYFIEILAVGGLSENGCLYFQSFDFWYYAGYPFAIHTLMNSSNPFFRLCGSHEPFITVMPGNTVLIRSYMMFNDRYTSLKFTYTATDMLVSHVIKVKGLM